MTTPEDESGEPQGTEVPGESEEPEPTNEPANDETADGATQPSEPGDEEQTPSQRDEPHPVVVEPKAFDAVAPAAATGTARTYIQQDQSWFVYVGPGESLDALFTKANSFGAANTTTVRLRGPGGIDELCTLDPAELVGSTCPFPNRTSTTPGAPIGRPRFRARWFRTAVDPLRTRGGRGALDLCKSIG